MAKSTEMQKVFDPKGLAGILARGKNIYMGGQVAAPGAGRPRDPHPVLAQQMTPAVQEAINQRLMSYGRK